MRHSAKEMTGGRPLVGVIVDGVSSYGRGVLRGVMRYANLQRRWVLQHDLWALRQEGAVWPECDGTVIAGLERDKFEYVKERSRYMLACSGGIDPSEMPVVCLDEEATGAMAAEHLIDCRLEHFAFFGMRRHSVAGRRHEGFQRALAAKGFECSEISIEWPRGAEWTTHAHWPKLIEQLHVLPKPVGIMAADDLVANDLAGACLKAEIAVPDKVAIVGVNNDDLLCESAWPPISSVEADYTRVGYEAAKLMQRLLAGEKLKGDARKMQLPPLGVVKRQSTSVLAVSDPNLADAVRFIREHACDPCSVDDVLRQVPVNRRWLERQFRSQLGRTPHEEITRVRMETARRLLLHRDLRLPDVAERCGYAGFQNFARVFRVAIGRTPAVYRREALPG